MCLRFRSAALEMFFNTFVAMASEFLNQGLDFQSHYIYFVKYCIDIKIALLLKVKHLLVSSSFKLSLC